MQFIKYPENELWSLLAERPQIKRESIVPLVSEILMNIREQGDSALKKYLSEFDSFQTDKICFEITEFEEWECKLDLELEKAITQAAYNIQVFHEHQKTNEPIIETTKGVKCWRKSIAIEKVGLYIPGGTAPLFSTVLMLAIPAKIAGCKDIIISTPAKSDGTIHPAILFAAKIAGVTKICKMGGAHAIGAMAFGTESVIKVDKIFGPGNQYVTLAKQLVAQSGVAIDMPAGPSEVLIIADECANPAFVASDLLAQAEHGSDSQVLLVSNNEELILSVLEEVNKQLKDLPRAEIAKKALENSKAILLKTLDEAMAFSNHYAPEHLILACNVTSPLIESVVNAGSVFVGNYSPESAGDYASGTNHTLPTNGYAKSYSGVSLDSFFKKVTFQQLELEGLKLLGPAIIAMAKAEGLEAHARAVELRIKEIN